jgi:hypothetical protein
MSLDPEALGQAAEPEPLLEGDEPRVTGLARPVPEDAGAGDVGLAEVEAQEKIPVGGRYAQPDKVPEARPDGQGAADPHPVGIDEPEVEAARAGPAGEDVPVREVAMEDALVVAEDEQAGQRGQEPGELVGRELAEERTDLDGIRDEGREKIALFDDAEAGAAFEVGPGERRRDRAFEAGGRSVPSPGGLAGNGEGLKALEARCPERLEDGLAPGRRPARGRRPG